ncbi:MAG TPA: ATP-binding protein, partial [Planctomycetota bacterium]|nr:ATP-binding protein [Planctomycetota bacterium]
DLDLDACTPLLPQLLARQPGLKELGLLGPDGRVLVSAGERPPPEPDRALFARALQSRRFAVGIGGMPDGSLVLRSGHPIFDAGGSVKAVLYAGAALAPLDDVVRRVPLPADTIVQVLDDGGRPIAQVPRGKPAAGADPAAPPVGPAAEEVGEDGVARRRALTPLRSAGDPTGGMIAVSLPLRALTGPAEADLLRSMAVVGSVAAIALLASWLFGSWFIMDRVNGLLKATRRLSTGNAKARRPGRAGRGGELGALERAFDEMAMSLEARTNELRRAEALYREIVEMNPAAFYVSSADLDAAAQYVSPRMEELTGWPPSEWTARPGLRRDIVDPADRERVVRDLEEAARNGGSWEIEYRVQRRDGRVTWVRDRGVVLPDGEAGRGLVRGFLVDVSDRKALEQQFLQAQKMEALGRLSASVAHDFNNLLTVMSGYSQLLQMRFGSDAAVKGQLEEITRAADRASVLTRQLLHFSRRQGAEPVVLDLNDALNSLDRMVRRLIGDRIDVKTSLAPGLHPVRVDRGHVDQVVMNLVVNARDAMPNGGTLHIRTENVDLDEEAARRRDGAKPGPHVCLVVADTGCGMDEAVKERVFEPFFTTKGEGKGTGLGLSTVYGIVRQARGHIVLDTAPGKGSAFSILLPRHEGALTATAAARTATGSLPPRACSVLVIEDDEALGRLARDCLEAEGHRVVVAGTVAEARAAVDRPGAAFDAIVADASLPDGDGGKFAGDLTKEKPGLAVVIVSGFSRAQLREEGCDASGFPFVAKPYRPADLRGALDRALARARRSTGNGAGGHGGGAGGAEAGT